MKRKYRSFQDARKFVHKLKLKSSRYWSEYCKSGKKPNDIPGTAYSVYKKDWKGMGDWLGTGNVANADLYKSGFYLPYKNARKFVHSLNIKTQLQWNEYCRSGKKPKNIPKNANRVYVKQWKSYGDWLGTGRVANQNRKYRPFKQARKYVHSLKLKDTNEWKTFCKSGELPDDIPSGWSVYKECSGIGDWLGTGSLSSIEKSKQYLPYKNARTFVHSLKLKNTDEWRKYQKKNRKQLAKQKIPPSPEQAYENKGWDSFGDWLGTGRVANQKMKYRSYDDAKKYVQKLKIKSVMEWNDYCKSGKKPDDVPTIPSVVYKKEWKGWGNFTGTGKLSSIEQSKLWLPIKEAKIEARKIAKELGIRTIQDWNEAYRSGKIPNNLPMNLSNVYGQNYKKHLRNKK